MQTTYRFPVLMVSEVALYLHAAHSDTVRLVPMQLCIDESTIREANRGESLHLAPVASAESTDQARVHSDSAARGNRLDSTKLANDLEWHATSLAALCRRRWRRR